MAGPDYIVDINGLRTPDGRLVGGAGDDAVAHHAADGLGADGSPSHNFRGGRRWLAVLWRCCSAYSRIYRSAAGDAYEGRCPKCGRAVRVGIGPDGTACRFFEAR